ncbi:AAA ATPase family protein [Wolbachia endosymbiont of Armadillidium vulgare str. wVulC]|uniref:AAA family ATPase n=1 Tax=Wolbachia endosymbiont of Armadillidium vulgare TaxID=77039 RepID=UPI00064B3115|nr:AAA family ATPase [Wolbachia endosymbiont of Armadillidium vulgare]KLT22854.1 AAA ATPase family protein [Wolbachia endosymbiont of Armadillidium vulgare str. wVulC]OJH31671.1 ATP-dependent zinc metalloprotease FtsH [Wolbachia endosymbiont of Armadillidium vulgare]OJH32080.1 ATP-dependent zinc metalloprotease FtsH [Wolbachia endosymbiont of Armadillidium vulgare]OJH32637.1 ATP-dependent zinc metalloprotease FtsH [Wolbachia endosymbiont of Armadillidium vulgare]OJH33259.1 ATP-dependent zinc m
MNFSKFAQGDSLELLLEKIAVSELVSFLQSSPNITKLSLKICDIGDEEIKALANGNLINITSLNLQSNKIGDEGAKALANGNLINLTELDLLGNKIGDEGAKALTNIKKLTLCRLDNNNTSIKGKGDFDTMSLINEQGGSPIEIFDPTQSESKTTLDEIIIPESLRKELNKILDFIPEENKALLQKTGYKPEKGYLFYGPPGNGKTKIARAIACQANAKFISVSAPEFLKSYIGAGEAHVRKLFKEARANAPCIVFIDEIDCIATERGSGGSSSHAQLCDSLVNQFLIELDGFNPLEGVTVIAATNRKDVLDKAFIRPGRLSNHIEIPLPDKTQRENILNLYIRKFKDNEKLKVTVDTKKLADKTDGFSGAELENLINRTAWDIIYHSNIKEGKVTISMSNFIKAINDLKRKKSQEPEGKQVNGDLELLNSPKLVLPNCSSDVHIDNADNVESHSSANSSSDVVGTLQQWSKIAAAKFGDIQTQINVLEEKYDEKFEELDSRNSDLEQGLDCVRKELTKITQCTEEHTQLQDTLESMVTELKKHESTLENRVKDLQKQFEGKNKELNSKYEKFLGASNNSKRQGSYASISFVLSGASAVGASLTMFHLAMCLSFAVAALIFLAAGCYCLYKANTTLSNVEIDQTTNLVVA